MHRTPNSFTEFWGEKKGMFREKQQKGMFQLEETWFVSWFRNVWRNLVTSVSKLTNITARKLHQTHGATLCFWGFWGIAPHLGSENTSSPGSLADPQYHKGSWTVLGHIYTPGRLTAGSPTNHAWKERKEVMIWTKPPGNDVPAVNLQGCMYFVFFWAFQCWPADFFKKSYTSCTRCPGPNRHKWRKKYPLFPWPKIEG